MTVGAYSRCYEDPATIFSPPVARVFLRGNPLAGSQWEGSLLRNHAPQERVKYTRAEYRKLYLRSPEWQDFRSTVMDTRPDCERCGKPATDLHHLIYREDIHQVRASDVMPLCRACHDLAHKAINLRMLPDPGRLTDAKIGRARRQVISLDGEYVEEFARYMRQKAILPPSLWLALMFMPGKVQRLALGILKHHSLVSAKGMKFTNSRILKVDRLVSYCNTKHGLADVMGPPKRKAAQQPRRVRINYAGKAKPRNF